MGRETRHQGCWAWGCNLSTCLQQATPSFYNPPQCHEVSSPACCLLSRTEWMSCLPTEMCTRTELSCKKTIEGRISVVYSENRTQRSFRNLHSVTQIDRLSSVGQEKWFVKTKRKEPHGWELIKTLITNKSSKKKTMNQRDHRRWGVGFQTAENWLKGRWHGPWL